jgi:hypothetical protein
MPRKTMRKYKGTAGACDCVNQPLLKLPLPESFKTMGIAKGGNCGCAMGNEVKNMYSLMPKRVTCGYRATKKDKKYLKMWKQGKSIGFTMRSSLKAKGLIPRANGTRRVSNKYR